MRWVPWALGIAGIAQFAVMALVGPDADYVSLDMAYLVMWLSIIGGLLVCSMGCYGDCYGGGGCGCCDDGCACGDCGNCKPGDGHDHGEHGHEGHSH